MKMTKPGKHTMAGKNTPSALASALSAAAACMLVPAAMAQATPQLAQPTTRITSLVSDESLVTLKGNVLPGAKAQFDQGAAPASTATGRMVLLLRPSATQQQALREYLGSLQDPHSASYHKWLTPASYGANFGISDQDLQTVEAWLRGEGFSIDAVPASNNLVEFSGNFGQIAQAFHTSIHTYLIGGVRHYANATNPSIPAALAPVVVGVSPLNDVHPKPTLIQQVRGQAQKAGLRAQMVGALQQKTSPAYTSPINGTNYLLVTAADAATIYDSPNTFNGNFTGTTQYTGSGINIGLVGDSDLPLADYMNYRTTILGEASPPQPTLVVDGNDPGQVNDGSSEEALVDAEFSAALAPQAGIYFYSSADDLLDSGAVDAAIRAVEDNNVSILSVSFGECESDLGASGNAEIDAVYQQAAAQGITVLVSSGDTGSASCDGDVAAENTAQYGLSVNGLGSTPYNISVGGTDFDVLSTNFSQYVNTDASATSSYRSALGYIPENPWDESISNNPPGSYTTDTAQQYTETSGGTPFTVLAAGGGGPSTSAVCPIALDSDGNCDVAAVGYATPSFQTGITVGGSNTTAVPAGVRYLPDVSLFASSGSEHPATWLVCADSTVTEYTGTPYVDCQPDSTGAFGFDGVGGTSTSSPAFAGILAMVAQSQGGGRLGLADNALYNIAATNSNASSIFHDITAGNNSVPCTAGTPNCGSNGFETGWNAGTGYDLATGLGSVDISKLITGWGQQSFTATTVALTAGTSATSLNTTPLTVQHGTNIVLSAMVDPTAAMGDVSVTGPTGLAGEAVTETIPLTSGAGQITVNDLPGGTYSVQGYYQGDVSHSPSTTSNPIQFTISPETSSPFLSVYAEDVQSGNEASNPTSLNYGEYGFAYVQPANSNAGTAGVDGSATGTATLLNGTTAFATTYFANPQTLNSIGVAAFPLYNLPPATYTLNASYSGDASFDASSTSSGYGVIINKGPTTLAVHVGNATAAAPGALQVVLSTDSIGANPTGAVTLMVNGTSYTGTVANEVLSDGAVAELVTYAVPASAFTSGTGYSLTATYAGDGNYASSSASSCTYVPPTTTARSTPTGLPEHGQALVLAAGCGLCSVLFLLIPARRRAWRSLLVLCFAVGLLGVTGCGSSSSVSPTTITVHSTCAQ